MSANRRWAKTWCRPRFTAYRAAAPRRIRLMRNRYGSSDGQAVTIGVLLQLGSLALTLTWAHPYVTRAHP